jgi:hypothetical protein
MDCLPPASLLPCDAHTIATATSLASRGLPVALSDTKHQLATSLKSNSLNLAP